MTLDQFQDLRYWHLRHHRDHPLEGHIWTGILTLWMIGWVGTPTVWILHWDWTAIGLALFVFAPGAYVAARRWLHRRRWLRCDWIVLLR
jgi:hypothetical protein